MNNRQRNKYQKRNVQLHVSEAQEEREKKRQETLRKMRVYKLHVSEVDILEEAGEL